MKWLTHVFPTTTYKRMMENQTTTLTNVTRIDTREKLVKFFFFGAIFQKLDAFSFVHQIPQAKQKPAVKLESYNQ